MASTGWPKRKRTKKGRKGQTRTEKASSGFPQVLREIEGRPKTTAQKRTSWDISGIPAKCLAILLSLAIRGWQFVGFQLFQSEGDSVADAW